jgi:hypothetical protein
MNGTQAICRLLAREPDHSGRHVDIDDSVRIGARKIRNLSPKQAKLLAPRIDRGEVRL